MFSKLRNTFVGLLVIAASTVAVTVSNSPVSATGTVAPSAVTSSPSIGAQNVPTWTNTNIISITAGSEHTCAIQGSTPSATTGSVFCWGKARSIGDGTSNNANVPVLVASNDGFVNTAVSKVEAGGDTTCAIEAGSLWCWGGVSGLGGQLGNGTTSSSPLPVKVSPNGTGAEEFFNNGNVTDVDASFARTCAIESGKVFCWGYENDALGLGGQSASPSSAVPNRVADSATPGFRAATATELHMGFNFHCAQAGGQLWCWGFGSSGELGDGGTGFSNRPQLVGNSSPGSEFTNASLSSAFMGDSHGCAIVSGTLSCWGRGANGRLGNGGTTDQLLPAAVQAGGGFVNNTSAVTSGAATDKHTCAIESGRLYCWGLNSDGRLGDGTSTASNVPVLVSPSVVTGFTNTGTGTGVVTAVAAGTSGGSNAHTCAIENKVAYCWGGYGVGQLGMGAQAGPGSNKPVKVFVVSAPAAPTISVSAGQSGTLSVGVSKPDDGGSTITSYEYSVDNGSPTAVAFDGFNYQTITISGLTNGTQYSVKVRAVNAIGAGAWSAASNGTPSSGSGSGGGSCTGGASISPSSTSGVGTVGTPMSLSGPTPSGYTVAPTFSISGVPLPAGLTLNAQTGAVTGTPTSTSFASVIIDVVSGAQSCQYNIMFSITPSSGGGVPPCVTGAPTVTGSQPVLDATWGTNGWTTFQAVGAGSFYQSSGLVPTSDNNFLLIGSGPGSMASQAIDVRKFDATGALVNAFGTNGRLLIEDNTASWYPSRIAVDSTGKIYVLAIDGSQGPGIGFLIRLTSTGTLDTSYDTDGILPLSNLVGTSLGSSLAPTASGDVYVVSSSSAQNGPPSQYVSKFSTSGLDTNFGTSGSIDTSSFGGRYVAVLADGSLVVGGSTQGQLKLAKYSSAGVADSSWATSGVATFGNPSVSESARSVIVDGEDLIVPYMVSVFDPNQQGPPSMGPGVAKVSAATGAVDTTFGIDGGVHMPVQSGMNDPYQTMVLSDGSIVMAAFTGASGSYTGGLLRFSSTGQVDAAFASGATRIQHGTCGVVPPSIVELGNGSVLFAGGKEQPSVNTPETEVLVGKFTFGAFSAGTPGGGFSVGGSPSVPPTSAPTTSAPTTTAPTAGGSTSAPTLVTSANAAALVRAPGAQSIIVNGEEVVIESNTVNIPAARTPESQRTPAQVASIQQAGAALLQQFLASLPSGATSNVLVVDTATGAVMQNLVFDANGNSVNVPVEDIVFLDGPQLSLMIGSDNANITADGKYQVGAGGIVGVTGSGLGASANGELIAMSTPTLLANFQTTAAGDFNKSATLPSSIGVGDHTLVVATGTTYAMMGIRVVPGALPSTGSSTENVVIIALFTLVFGALFFRGRRISLI